MCEYDNSSWMNGLRNLSTLTMNEFLEALVYNNVGTLVCRLPLTDDVIHALGECPMCGRKLSE